VVNYRICDLCSNINQSSPFRPPLNQADGFLCEIRWGSSTLHTEGSTLHAEGSTLHAGGSTLHAGGSTHMLKIAPCILKAVPCSLKAVPCTVKAVPCTLYLEVVPCTLKVVPCFLSCLYTSAAPKLSHVFTVFSNLFMPFVLFIVII
jgi:hypothetical protein